MNSPESHTRRSSALRLTQQPLAKEVTWATIEAFRQDQNKLITQRPVIAGWFVVQITDYGSNAML